ncbi:MAG: hypothetical protein ACRD3J_30355, partial [Thermoanaerobaculia bacterium]
MKDSQRRENIESGGWRRRTPKRFARNRRLESLFARRQARFGLRRQGRRFLASSHGRNARYPATDAQDTN